MLAIERNLDLFGVVFLGAVTAIGGGIIRDLLLGQVPPQAFLNYVYLLFAVLTALVPEWLGWGVVAFPEFTGMDSAPRTGVPMYRPAASWPMAGLFYLLSQAAGACLGRVMTSHKVLGVILMVLFWILASGLVAVVLIVSGMDLQFGPLVPIFYGVFAALTLVCALLLRRWVLQATVR